jgi:glycosyltransferase involved in cell wall biosynthesis
MTKTIPKLKSNQIKYYYPLYRRLAQEPSIDLTVYYCSRQGLDAYADEGFGGEIVRWDVPLLDGYRSVFLDNLNSSKSVGGFWSLRNPGIVRALRKERYDALWVHGHNYLTYILAYASARLSGTAIFTRGETHLLLKRTNFKRMLRKPLLSALYSQCDACLAIGSRNADFYRHHGVPDENIFLVPYTVDNYRFMAVADEQRPRRSMLRVELGVRPGLPIVMYASKFTARKRPMDLLRAKKQLELRGLNCSLLMIGAGEDEAMLRDFVSKNGLRDVHFLGFRNQSDLPRYYALADVFVLPSENEPWGLVLNEVMCAGVAIVATEEIGSVADLVKVDDNGLLYPAGDVAQLVERLAIVLTDGALCERMGRRSRAIIQDWDYGRCVDGIKAALNSTRLA